MTNNEAIGILGLVVETAKGRCFVTDEAISDAYNMAVNALKKQIPVKPIRIDKNKEFDGNWIKVCPFCKSVLIERITTDEKSYPLLYNYTPHCKCGQAIDWDGK